MIKKETRAATPPFPFKDNEKTLPKIREKRSGVRTFFCMTNHTQCKLCVVRANNFYAFVVHVGHVPTPPYLKVTLYLHSLFISVNSFLCFIIFFVLVRQ